jgi:hypothetical protein
VPRPNLFGVWVIVCCKYRSQLMEAASAESSRSNTGFPSGQVSPALGLHAVLGLEKVLAQAERHHGC